MIALAAFSTGILSCTLEQRQVARDKRRYKQIISNIQFPISREQLYSQLPPLKLPSMACLCITTGSGTRGSEYYPLSDKVGLRVLVHYYGRREPPISKLEFKRRETALELQEREGVHLSPFLRDIILSERKIKQDARDWIDRVNVQDWYFDLNEFHRDLQQKTFSEKLLQTNTAGGKGN